MFRSATFKLTMWYLALVMVISIGFSFAVYHFATNELSFGLEHQTQRIFRQYPVFSTGPLLRSQGDDVLQGSHHILLRLAYFNLLVLISAGFASYWLAQRTLRPIQNAHERQKRFTADVSHELRTPLTSLKMSSEVALLDTQASKQALRSTLQSNLEDAGKMDALINNLLRLTQLETHETQNGFSNFSASGLINGAIEQVAQQAKQKKITIANDATDISLYGDQDALQQLIVILLDNAIKYSDKGGTINIASKQANGSSQLIVKDEGQGISAEQLPHIFDRFYRADESRTKTADEGFGLGLSIAKLIADRHDGAITISSRPKKGTTVVISLPQSK